MGYYYPPPNQGQFVGGAQPNAPSLGLVQSGIAAPASIPPVPQSAIGAINQWWGYDPHIIITLPSAAGNIGLIPIQPNPTSLQGLLSIIRQWDPPLYSYLEPQENQAALGLPPPPPVRPVPVSWANFDNILVSWIPPSYYPPAVLQQAAPQASSGVNTVFVTMPNVIGLTTDAATIIVNAIQGFVQDITYEDATFIVQPLSYPTQPLPRGIVIGQWPLPGAQLLPVLPPAGFYVTLIASSGLMNLPGVGHSVSNPPNVVTGSIN